MAVLPPIWWPYCPQFWPKGPENISFVQGQFVQLVIMILVLLYNLSFANQTIQNFFIIWRIFFQIGREIYIGETLAKVALTPMVPTKTISWPLPDSWARCLAIVALTPMVPTKTISWPLPDSWARCLASRWPGLFRLLVYKKTRSQFNVTDCTSTFYI